METNYPWYDGVWLRQYGQAKQIITAFCPERLEEFINKLSVFKTDTSFEVIEYKAIFTDEKLAEVKQFVNTIKMNEYEKQEFLSFGRLIKHDLPYFTQLQRELTATMSQIVGQEVEPCYNFLSLYNNFGICNVHMDAPSAKWTLDVCIDQSDEWPIHFSQTVPWPEDFNYQGDDWEAYIKNDPKHTFTSYALKSGEALIFSGSSQWHYRDRIANRAKSNFCNLVFFHFIPKGTLELSHPKNWARIFGIHQLNEIVHKKSNHKYGFDELFITQVI